MGRISKKQAANNQNYYENPDPFLISNTLIASGTGKAVVCCVGANSRRGCKEEKLDTSSKTPL
jgi:magnesium-transporting ATPase (P-type)